jgi:hypothetical protein
MEFQATPFHRDRDFESIASITSLDKEYFEAPNP